MADVIWALGLLETAARGCPATFAWLASGLCLLVLVAAAVSRARMRASTVLFVLGALCAACAWVARDRLLLLGDSRVWLHNAEILGNHLPAYRAPLSAVALGWLADALRGVAAVQDVLAVVGRRLQVAPEDDVARFNAAAAWSRLGLLERAAEELAEAARLRPENRQYQLQLLRVLLALPDGEARVGAYLQSLSPALAESLRAVF